MLHLDMCLATAKSGLKFIGERTTYAMPHAKCPGHSSAFDLAVHTVNLCEHVFGPGLHLQVSQLAVRVVLNAQFILDGIEHVQHTSDLMLREEPNLQI